MFWLYFMRDEKKQKFRFFDKKMFFLVGRTGDNKRKRNL